MTALSSDNRVAGSLPEAKDWAFWALFGGAFVVLVTAQVLLWPINGLWLDELFTLEATDPSLPLIQNYLESIAPDTNPPLYPVLVRLVRTVVGDGRIGFIVCAAIFLALTLAFVLWTARRARAPRLGLAAAAAFMISGPVLTYFPEGRAYFLAMCFAFATIWAAALNTITGRREIGLGWFIALGALGTLTHTFGAIFAGAVAAAMIGYGLFARRRDLIAPGLALGVITVVVFAIWFASIQGSLNRVSWIRFTLSDVREAAWYARTLTIGPAFMVLPLAAVLAYALRASGARPVLALFGATFFSFIALPLAASFFTPMIVGRYWAIGGPVVGVLLVFVVRAYAQWPHATARRGAAAAALTLSAMSAFGLPATRTFTLDKPIWSGAPMVAELGVACPDGAIRITDYMLSNGVSFITGLPRTRFADVTKPATATRRVADAPCALAGWSEHFLPVDGYNDTMPDATLLARLKLEALPGEVEIVRHKTGYVVLKAGARNTAPAQ